MTCGFALGNDIVMAAFAGPDHVGVIDSCDRRPHTVGMAIVADLGAADVINRFAASGDPIVA